MAKQVGNLFFAESFDQALMHERAMDSAWHGFGVEMAAIGVQELMENQIPPDTLIECTDSGTDTKT